MCSAPTRDHIGYNVRLDTLQAAIKLAKFNYVEEFNQRRRKIAELYTKKFKSIDGLSLPMPFPDVHHVYNQYTIGVKNGKRDNLQRFLKEQGIGSMIYYPVSLHKMKVFNGRGKVFADLKESEQAVKEVLSLPIEPLMEEDIMKVVRTVRKFFTN